MITSIRASVADNTVKFSLFLGGLKDRVSDTVFDIVERGVEAMRRRIDRINNELTGNLPVLIGSRGSSATQAAVDWLNENNIAHLLCTVPEPFFVNVEFDDDDRMKIEGLDVGVVHPMLFTHDDVDSVQGHFKSIGPPLLLLRNNSRGNRGVPTVICGFDASQYRAAFGLARFAEDFFIDPSLTAHEKHAGTPELVHAVAKLLRNNSELTPHREPLVLDFGCGNGAGVALLRDELGFNQADGFDPNFKEWSGIPPRRYDVVILHRVLNAIPTKTLRDQALDQVCVLFEPKLVVVAVPTLFVREKQRGRYFTQPFEDGVVHFDSRGTERADGKNAYVFQRGFDQDELDKEFDSRGFKRDQQTLERLFEFNDAVGGDMRRAQEDQLVIFAAYVRRPEGNIWCP